MIDKSKLRSKIFKHLDGLVTAPVAVSLNKKGVLQHFLDNGSDTLANITAHFRANEGYLNVALRIFCSQGYLVQQINPSKDEITFTLTDRGRIAFPMMKLYEDVVALLDLSGQYHPRKFEVEPFNFLNGLFDKYKVNFGIEFSADEQVRAVQQNMLDHIEGFLVGPTLVHLGMGGMFHKYFMETSFEPEEFHQNPDCFRKMLNFFVHLGWYKEKNGKYQFTETGLFFAKRAPAYGVTVSYSPMFRRMDDLLFGDPAKLREIAENEDEIHVDREMNVWGSGGAHSNYFKVIDEIIIELFNKPINEQPKGVLDMGCGNGAFLQHIFEVIERQTKRGEMLDEHPLFLVGVDYNGAALKVTRSNLIKADIWAKVIWGDIGRPDLLANELKEDYNIEIENLLNVRTFLDHNRIWEDPEIVTENRISDSTGAFAHRGRRIQNNLIEDNLLNHLKKWSPYLQRFGLLLIELHTIAPEIAAKSIGKSAATAYDATHGFSDQYIVEIDVFHKICKEAGLFPDMKVFRKFPNSELATVSINLLKGR